MRLRKIAIFFTIVSLEISSLVVPHTIDSSSLGSTKDTLQSSRLSGNFRVNGTITTAGGSVLTILTSASDPANTISTDNLKPNDVLYINGNTYTISAIVDASSVEVTPVLAAPDVVNGTPVYMKQMPRHVVTFTTASAIPNGFFQILLPAAVSNSNDAKPDSTGFDFNGPVNVTAVASPSANYNFVTGVATASGGTGCTAPANYHCFEVHYSGTGSIGAVITIFIGNTNGVNTPIAPNEASGHTPGSADTYSFLVKQFSANQNPNTASPVDSTTGRLAVNEAVRVTATVAPTITFSIQGVASAQTRCGVATNVDTSTGTNAPLAVPFGTLSLNTFSNAAHLLTVSTNAANGYAVTAVENDQLGKDGGTTPFIADTTCDTGTCTNTTSAEWNTATNNGFGYAIQLGTAATASATYAGYNELTRTFSALQFPATIESEAPQQIMGDSTIANAETAWICYRISVGATQAAGNYENQITYTATATF